MILLPHAACRSAVRFPLRNLLSRQLRLDFAGALWHVTSRGNERREIYRDDSDRRLFVQLLDEVVVQRKWILHAWVLMSNHYHLLFETPEVGLSRGMKWLNQEYAQSFNVRHRRVGHLFQGRFKGILVERESHLLELVRYIVLNPVRCGAVRFAGDYEWSNYRATAGLETPPPWLETRWTLDQFHPARRIAESANSQDVHGTRMRILTATGRCVTGRPRGIRFSVCASKVSKVEGGSGARRQATNAGNAGAR